MQIDEQLILKLESLARLELAADERIKLQSSLNDILTMVEKLNELNTEGVEPLIYINENDGSLRDDTVKNQLDQAAALSNAPDHNAAFFKVPKVIDL